MTEHERAFGAYQQGEFAAALAIWQPLAECGDAIAQSWLGALYVNGEGVAADYTVGFGWYLKAAENGDPKAQANVGTMYYAGQGVEKDLAQAFRWTKAAADSQDQNGQFNLAVFYTKGIGTAVDDEKAAQLYLQGARVGHYPSQSRVGYMYAHGKGVAKNRAHAYLWLTLAAQHGIGSALDALETVVKQMSVEEKAEGEQLSGEWRMRTGSSKQQVALMPSPG